MRRGGPVALLIVGVGGVVLFLVGLAGVIQGVDPLKIVLLIAGVILIGGVVVRLRSNRAKTLK